MEYNVLRINHYLGVGMSAVSFAGILGIIQVSQLDAALHISLGCFSLALPFNVTISLLFHEHTGWFVRLRSLHVTGIVNAVATILGLVGIGSVLWHFHWAHTIVFACSILGSLLFVGSVLKDKSEE